MAIEENSSKLSTIQQTKQKKPKTNDYSIWNKTPYKTRIISMACLLLLSGQQQQQIYKTKKDSRKKRT